jgi:hypothetical protein
VLFVADLALGLIDPALPEPVAAYLDENMGPLFAALDTGAIGLKLSVGALLFAYLAAWITALVGLLKFRRWARALFLVTVGLNLVLLTSGGTTLTSPLQSAMSTLASMAEGAIVVLLFVEPVRSEFARKHFGFPAPPAPPVPPA